MTSFSSEWHCVVDIMAQWVVNGAAWDGVQGMGAVCLSVRPLSHTAQGKKGWMFAAAADDDGGL